MRGRLLRLIALEEPSRLITLKQILIALVALVALESIENKSIARS